MRNSLIHSHLYAPAQLSVFYHRLYEWYESNCRVLPWRETEDGYCIWLSEVILQQTRVAQGMDYYLRFVNRWPDVRSLAEAAEEEVLREWQGLGYYSRARNLHKAAQTVVARGWEPFPTRFEDIRSLPGIGDYTAGAICSFAYNQPYPAMDGNVYRVIARLMDIDEPFDTSAGKKLFRQQIDTLLDREHPRLFNSAIMEFGALWCTPQVEEHCETCPLQAFCLGYARHTAPLLPVRKPRPKLRDRWLEYSIYLCAGTTLISRREEKDIWFHLYEFPCIEKDSETPSKEAEDKDKCVKEIELTHVLSHQRLHARFRLYMVKELPHIPDTVRIRWEELDNYALSRLTLKAISGLAVKH